MRDAHKILSVGRNASLQEIKSAYRRLALKLHPDTNGGDTEKSERFKQVNEAYTYLTDPKSKEFESFDADDVPFYGKKHHYRHTSSSHWNPFQSPFQNVKNDQRRRGNPDFFQEFEEWDDFEFFDFEEGEEVTFGFDKNGKAKTSRKNSGNKGKKKKNQRKSSKDPFSGFTAEDIEDIIRNSSSSHNNHRARSPFKNNKKSSESSPRYKKSSRSRRRRGDNDDCTIS